MNHLFARDGNGEDADMGARRQGFGIARVIIFIGVLAVLVGGGIYAVSFLLSPNFIVQRLQQAVKQQTGRTLTIGGRPNIRFYPRIAVSLPDVRLSSPPGFGKGDFIRMQRLELVVELWPLLQRELILKKLHMVAPRIHLMVDAKGRNNWTFDTGASGGGAGTAGSGGGLLKRIRLAPVIIEGGQVIYDDARAKAHHEVQNLDVAVKLASPDSPLSIKGGADWRGQRVKLSLFVKRPQALSGDGSPVEAFLETAGAKIEYQGLAGFGKGLRLAGNLSASGPSLRGLLHWLGAGLPATGRGLGKFSLKAAVEADADAITLKKLQLALDESRAQGSVRLRTGKTTTAITAALGVDRLVTDTYLGPPPQGGNKKAVGRGGGWSDAAIMPDLPRNLSADLRISVNDLRHRKLKMGPGTARFVVKNGAFKATLQKMAFYGGGLGGTFSITPGKKKPQVAAEFRVNKVRAMPFLTDFADFRHVSGTLTGLLDVKSAGRSQLELAGNLRGLANLEFSDGKIHGVNLVKLMELVQKGIVQGWNFSANDTTDFVELKAQLVFVDGIAGVRTLSMKGPLVQVSGKGEIDLLRQRLELSLDGALVKRKEGEEKTLLRMPAPLLVKGPWQNPKIYPDIAGILKNPEAALQQFQKLMRAVGAKKPAAKAGKVKDKAAEKVKATREKLERKVEKKLGGQLKKVLGKQQGEETAGKISEEAGKQMEKLLKGIFGKQKPPAQPAPAPAPQQQDGPVQLAPAR